MIFYISDNFGDLGRENSILSAQVILGAGVKSVLDIKLNYCLENHFYETIYLTQ